MAMHHPTSQVLRTVPAGATPRILLSALGAAGLIAAAFQSWTRDLQGTDVSWRSVYRDSIGSTDDIVQSIGGAAILLGVIAVMGFADDSGWLVRLVGAVGLVGSTVFVVQVYRSSDHGLQAGVWFALAGSLLCVIGGLYGSGQAVFVRD